MNNRIIQLLEDSSKIKFSDKIIIEQEYEKHPSVASFKMLYLKWKLLYHRENLDQSIQEAAIYISNRELIKQMVDETKFQNEDNIHIEPSKELEENIVDTMTNQDKDISLEHEEATHAHQQSRDEQQNHLTINDKVNENIEIGQSDISNYSYIKQLGLSHLFDTTDKEEISSKTQPTKNDEVVENENKVFVDKDQKEPIKEIKQEKLTFNQWLSLSQKGTKKTEKQEEIIHKFIENNPKITPPKKADKNIKSFEFKNEEIKDIANLMTITLAQLYVEQGKYDTAITAFKILSLKYPEKSSYFVSEIKKIKKLKNIK
ncbi:hypothetical protein ETU08_01370 [Apibacter muscae]|uniref:hypothetical protein n=1 Tax=Apibacter muscae TaxID=2509004 RepID=UPI0011ABE615|nr:hypothetical protein [Apibacter muscae]TWP31464.1 hypothetical protein ETU08_01370 [Apibacter muscae]